MHRSFHTLERPHTSTWLVAQTYWPATRSSTPRNTRVCTINRGLLAHRCVDFEQTWVTESWPIPATRNWYVTCNRRTGTQTVQGKPDNKTATILVCHCVYTLLHATYASAPFRSMFQNSAFNHKSHSEKCYQADPSICRLVSWKVSNIGSSSASHNNQRDHNIHCTSSRKKVNSTGKKTAARNCEHNPSHKKSSNQRLPAKTRTPRHSSCNPCLRESPHKQ